MSRPALLLGILVVLAALPLSAAGSAIPGPTADAVAPSIDDPLAQTNTPIQTQTTTATEHETNTTTANETDTTTDNETDEPRLNGLAFFTVSHRETAPPVTIGFGAEAGADGFFVLTNASGAVVGHTEYEDYDSPIHADGLPVPFTKPVTGVTTLTVTAHDDTNGNQEFDPGIDEPYRDDDGSTVSSTMAFLFEDETDVLEPTAVEFIPGEDTGGGLHHFRVEATRSMEIRAVALDYRTSDVTVPDLSNESAGVGLVYPELSNRRTGAKAVHEPLTNVVVIEPDDPFSVGSGDHFVVNVDGLPGPTDAQNVTVVLNPYGAAYSKTVTLEPDPAVPSIDLVQVGPNERSSVQVNLHFPEGRTGVVQISHDGTVIGRSQVVGGQPDMHVDFLDVRVDEELDANDEITVTLLTDVDADNNYEEPFRVDGEPLSTEVTVLQGWEGGEGMDDTPNSTTGPSDSETTTTVPGFGILLGILALLLGVLGVRD